MKRAFDVLTAGLGLLFFGWIIVLAAAVSASVHGGTGFFLQKRIGLHGRPFYVVKLTTMRPHVTSVTSVTTANDARITRLGRLLRRTKLDELPQLVNVFFGHMSLVGPRPDVPGFADRLTGPDRIILSVRPGMTGPASLAYRDEEVILAGQPDPVWYNAEVIYPDKVRMNRRYVERFSIGMDFLYLWRTLVRRRAACYPVPVTHCQDEDACS